MQLLTAAPLLHGAWNRLPSHDYQFELRAGSPEDQVYAHYDALLDITTLRAETGTWTFEKTGFWKTQIHVRRQGSSEEAAILAWKSAHSLLTLPDGRHFEWHYHPFPTSFVIQDGSVVDLLSFTSICWPDKNPLNRCQATMEIKSGGKMLPELEFLALMAWYTLLPTMWRPSGGNYMTP